MAGVVGTLRFPLYWYEVEPRRGRFEFAKLDEVVGTAADRGIRVLPVVYGSPDWVTGDPARPPLGSAGHRRLWATFLQRLVRRYGPHGEFWRGLSRRAPIRRWQVWNEPNFRLFWHPHPSPRGYARLLRASADAIRAVDRRATIVAAGLAPVEAGFTPWAFLRRMYSVPGVRGAFDVVALHPYAPFVNWVATEIRLMRTVMAEAGDARTPLQLTEIGVASATDSPSLFDKGGRGQAAFLRRILDLVVDNRRRWRIAGVDWFTWRDSAAPDPHCIFCQHAGLFDVSGSPKPAWRALSSTVAQLERPRG